MVNAHRLLLTDGLRVNHLRLIIGTSMGCMQAWVWGYTYPTFADGLVPLAWQTLVARGAGQSPQGFPCGAA